MRKLAALTALTAALGFATAALAKPQQLDSYCSPTGDVCQEVTMTKRGIVKFGITTFSFSGQYMVCVKGRTGGNDCLDFVLERRGGAYSDTINWQRNFPDQPGTYRVTWKDEGAKIGKTLRFTVAAR